MHLTKEQVEESETMVSFVHSLPMVQIVPKERNAVLIDYMTDQQLTETYHMIHKAAKYGHGFGFREFTSEADFRNEIAGSNCFAVMRKEDGSLVASIILAQSKFYRGSNEVVDPFIIVKYSERCKGLGEFCMRKAVELSTSLGYKAMYVDTFTNNNAMIRIIDKIGGFQKVGVLPIGGSLPSGKYVSSLIYFRSLSRDEQNNT